MANNLSKVQIADDSFCAKLQIKQFVITEDRFRISLSNVYEEGVKDSEEVKWFDAYPVSLSVSGTLLLTCLTSQFNDLSKFISYASKDNLTIGAWILFALSFLYGIIAALFMRIQKKKDVFRQRDEAINAEISKITMRQELKEEN